MVCGGCEARIGIVDGREFRIYKEAIRVEGQEVPDPLHYLVASMLTTLDAHAVHRFLLQSDKFASDSLLIWILTPDARITASTVNVVSPGQRVMKIMYRQAEEQDTGEEDVEIMDISPKELASLERELHKNYLVLGAVNSKEWKSSFLSRFER